MSVVLSALGATAFQFSATFGMITVLAFFMYFVNQFARGNGSTIAGKFYYFFVAPGVICHETGHALGCILTRSRIVKFVPFHPRGNTLGYVTHESHGGLWGALSEFVIGTGPIWFGMTIVYLLGVLLGEQAGFRAIVRESASGTVEYATAVLSSAWSFMEFVFSPSHWTHWWFFAYLYFVYCISSETTLSPTDIKASLPGLSLILLVWFLANLVPGVTQHLDSYAFSSRHSLFYVHVTMMFTLIFDIAVSLCLRLLRAVLGAMA